MLVHSAHATARHCWRRLVFSLVHQHALGGEEQARDRRCVLQRAARDLGWIDDAGLHQVGVLLGSNIVTFVAFALLDFLDNERARSASSTLQI